MSMYVRARVTLDDVLEAVCRLAVNVPKEEVSQFDVDRLSRAVAHLQEKVYECSRHQS